MLETFLRPRQVQTAMGWSRSTLYQKISEGLFPTPVKLDADGRAVGWPQSEIVAYQQGRIQARDDAAKTA